MTEDQTFQLRNEAVRVVNVKLNRRMYRRLALSAAHGRRSLNKEAGHLLDQMLSSTIETDGEREAGEMVMKEITRKAWTEDQEG